MAVSNTLEGLTDPTNMVFRASATEGLQEVLRTTADEQSFVRPLLAAKKITPEDCDRLPTTRKPVKIDEMEQECDLAVTIPFGGQPMNSYMHLPLFITTFARNVSPRVYDDKANLMMYTGDIEKLFYTLLLREVLDQEVRAFIATADVILGDLGSILSDTFDATGAKGYTEVGSYSTAAQSYAMQALPSTYGNLAAATQLVNNITIWNINDVMRATAVGDSLAERTWLEGYQVVNNINGVDLMVTLKNRVVEDNDMYIFTDPDHLGRMYILEDATLVNENRGWNMNMFLYTMLGGSLPNSGALRKVKFSGTFSGSFKS